MLDSQSVKDSPKNESSQLRQPFDAHSLLMEHWKSTATLSNASKPPEHDSGMLDFRAGIKTAGNELLGADSSKERSSDIEMEGFKRTSDGSLGASSSVKDSPEDRLRSKIIDKMTPDERKRFDEEAAADKAWKQKMADWGSKDMLGLSPPEPPASPLHDRVEKQVGEAERRIRDGVVGGLSKEEATQLKSEEEKLATERAKELDRLRRPGQPFEPDRPKPAPGPMIRKVWERMSSEVEKWQP